MLVKQPKASPPKHNFRCLGDWNRWAIGGCVRRCKQLPRCGKQTVLWVQTLSRDGQTMTVPGFRVAEVVDTVGAGDGLALESITGLLDGLGLYDAMQRGNAVGAMAVQAVGDNDGYPTLIELETFMAQPV